MLLDFYNLQGKKEKSLELDANLFGTETSSWLIHRALVRQLANMRQGTAQVKTRSERRGWGRKPWAQKGTGKARQGSIRSAQWKKWGRIHGPSNDRNYTLDMPKKQRRQALFGALSHKAQNQLIIGLTAYSAAAPKTKEAVTFLEKFPIDRNILVIYGEQNEIMIKSFRNIPHAKVLPVTQLNVADLLTYRHLLLLEDAFTQMKVMWGTKTV